MIVIIITGGRKTEKRENSHQLVGLLFRSNNHHLAMCAIMLSNAGKKKILSRIVYAPPKNICFHFKNIYFPSIKS